MKNYTGDVSWIAYILTSGRVGSRVSGREEKVSVSFGRAFFVRGPRIKTDKRVAKTPVPRLRVLSARSWFNIHAGQYDLLSTLTFTVPNCENAKRSGFPTLSYENTRVAVPRLRNTTTRESLARSYTPEDWHYDTYVHLSAIDKTSCCVLRWNLNPFRCRRKVCSIVQLAEIIAYDNDIVTRVIVITALSRRVCYDTKNRCTTAEVKCSFTPTRIRAYVAQTSEGKVSTRIVYTE